MYSEEATLLLSGIQHFAFCRRQWALIHIEQQWNENLLTAEGKILHENAHEGQQCEKRGGFLITRSMGVESKELGIRGSCDVVEFHEAPDGVELFGREGKYLPLPVEYKRGRPKANNADALQLCAQAICLEEMLLCEIEKGYLYYGETRHRVEVAFTQELRDEVKQIVLEIHKLYNAKYTPKVKTGGSCRSCSLKDICLPKLCRGKTVSAYIRGKLEELE